MDNPDRLYPNSSQTRWGYSLTKIEYREFMKECKLFLMCQIDKCWPNITYLERYPIQVKIFFYILEILECILILEKFASFLEHKMSSRENMIHSWMWYTSKWKSWYNDIDRFWVNNSINMCSTHLIDLAEMTVFSSEF